jgi:hypothetical protein
VKQKVDLNDKKLRTQINGKYNDISSADENNNNKKNITVEHLLKKYKKDNIFIHR